MIILVEFYRVECRTMNLESIRVIGLLGLRDEYDE